jgi:ribosomal protein S18 acetylase RimI-like enzyme
LRLDERLQEHLCRSAAAGHDVVVVGPFTVVLDPADDAPFRNSANPAPGAPGAAQAMGALRAAFAERGRVPRLEFIASVAPALPATLRAAGFAEEARMPLMTCTPELLAAPAPVPGLTLETQTAATPDDGLRAAQRVQAEAFGHALRDGPSRRRRWLAGGGLGVLARIDGAPAGTAMADPPHDGCTELTGIATLPAFRRRGVAVAVTAACAELAFAAGAELAFLTPGDAQASRIYARAGFGPELTMLAYAASG